MNVFLSWSGPESRAVAAALNEWIPLALQGAKPWFSPESIELGRRWSPELATRLEGADFGVLCLTPTNMTSTWIAFEAGALSKRIDAARVCPYIIGQENIHLPGPFGQFQGALADQQGTKKLLESMFRILGDAAWDSRVLDKTFKTWWPSLRGKLTVIAGGIAASTSPPPDQNQRYTVPHSLGGLTQFSNSAKDFHQLGLGDFGDYLRRFVEESPAGTTVKIVGFDGTELFGSDIGGITEYYLRAMRDRKISLKVLLVDPTTEVPFRKRQSENEFVFGNGTKYEVNQPDRIYKKIVSACEVLAGYRKSCPDQIECGFIRESPPYSVVLRGGQAVCTLHSPCHKGWDSPVWLAEGDRSPCYSFLDQYFDFLWTRYVTNQTHLLEPYDSLWFEKYRMEFERLFPASSGEGQSPLLPGAKAPIAENVVRDGRV